MDVAVLGILIVGAAALAGFLLSFDLWLRSEDSFWARAWQTYKKWYDEQAAYLLDRTPAIDHVKMHAAYAIGALVLGLVVALTQPVIIVACFGIGVFIPFMLLKNRVQKRRHDLLMQIDPALQFMANALQVTPNVEEALLLVAQHMKPPISEEMRRVVACYRMGQSLDQALQGLADRCNDPFVTSLSVALVVGRRTGGNISQTLRDIALSTREITKVELELSSKTKGQRNQFYLVAALYPLTVWGLKDQLPSAWTTLTSTSSGLLALLGSTLVVVFATVWALGILNPKNL